ncbi:MAG: AI-2E family transporter [Patescibacteria group bacterium]
MTEDNRHLTINISTSAIFKVIAVLVLLALIYLLRDVILIILVSFILASALNPWVNALQRRRIPRVLATVIIFLAFFGTFVLILVLLIPPIATQITDISKNLPSYYNRIMTDFEKFKDFSLQQNILNSLQNSLQSLQSNLGQTAAGVFSTVASVFGGFVSFIFMVVITFYMLLEENALKKFIKSVTPSKYQPYIFQLINRAQDRLRLWLRGQLILCLIIGFLAWLGLTILGVKYSLVLGLWAGLTEFIPYLGPFLGGIPAVFIALTTGSFIKAVLVLGWYIVIQQLENHLIVPKVMEKTVGLNPLVVIIIMLIGGKLAGMVGILLAVPLALVIKVFAEDFFALKESEENTLEA